MNKKYAPPQLKRTTLTTSRMMEFCSEKELVAQIGHAREDWPLVVLKELIDNALDACEDTQTQPIINVVVDEHGICVSDNGPGIPKSTVKDMLNFSVRVSSREAYIAPDRGAQGNALKTLVAIPYALDGNQGQVEIIARGKKHVLTMNVDAIRQTPIIDRKTEKFVQKGTSVKIVWPQRARSILTAAKPRFVQFVQNYTFLNPHLKLNLDCFGEPNRIDATNSGWSKWLPSNPTPSHWYEEKHLSRLIAGYIAYDRFHKRDRTVRDFISEFRGLRRSAKQKCVLDESGLGQVNLSALADEQGIKSKLVKALLTAMCKHSKPVKPSALGVIGRMHLAHKFDELGSEIESFQYRKVTGKNDDGLPYVLEVGFAWNENLGNRRRLITGVNWSPGILDPFRQLDEYGSSLDDIFYECEVGINEPIVFFMHLATPRIEYTDRGKTAVVMRIPEEIIESTVTSVTKKWTKQRKAEKRRTSQSYQRRQVMKKSPAKISTKDAAYAVMESAYLKASTNNTLPATARQIMYAARPKILRRTGLDKLSDKYFIKTLLPDYMRDHPEQTATWDVVYDARGHHTEPHTGKEIGLGTLAVREYLQRISEHTIDDIIPKFGGQLYSTMGPKNRYSAILFIEKEGFMSLFEKVRLAERYDIAIMSTKGMSVTAARQLVDTLCSGKEAVPLLVLHDFDKSGFSIVGTLQRNTERFRFTNKVKVVDLGIRLVDIQKYNLESEDCSLGEGVSEPTQNLKENGATQEEINFLYRDKKPIERKDRKKKYLFTGRRVELNAFSSENLVEWIERKLEEHGIKKVIPDNETLKTAYRRAALANLLNKHIESVIDELKASVAKLKPTQLAQKVGKLLKQYPEMSWDQAIADIANNWAFNGSESENSRQGDTW